MIDHAISLLVLLEVLILFNLLILVHELGHFVVARRLGLVVDRFGIWFGKPLWKRKVDGVEFSVGWIPAGGFVSMPQMSPMEAVEGKSGSRSTPLPPVSPAAKIAVALAGPAASMSLALVLGCLVWFVGRPIGEAETSTVVGYVVPGGPAATAGILPGDRVLSVDGNQVDKFAGMGGINESVAWHVVSSEGRTIAVEYERGGEVRVATVTPEIPEREGTGRRHLRRIGMYPSQLPVVAVVEGGGPADLGGIRPGDAILSANGVRMLHPQSFASLLEGWKGGEMVLEVRRPSEGEFSLVVEPRVHEGETVPRIGIAWDERGVTTLDHPNPLALVGDSVDTIVATLSAVLSPRGEVSAEHLSGPVGIMRIYYLLFESPDGWRLALWFSVVLNVNLALLNLLPIPVLDGGHVVLGCVEAARRRPFAPRFLVGLQNASAMLIIGYMLYVTFFDLQDLPWFRPGP